MVLRRTMALAPKMPPRVRLVIPEAGPLGNVTWHSDHRVTFRFDRCPSHTDHARKGLVNAWTHDCFHGGRTHHETLPRLWR
jgi:hypothetical protein